MDTPRILEAVRSELAAATPDFLRREEAMRLLGLYVMEVDAWSRRMHLTGKESPEKTIPAQVADSLAMLQCAEDVLAAQPGRKESRLGVVDIGSGAGFPGIVWKIARPVWRVALVERKEKAAAFLRRTVAVLGLGELEVMEQDACRIQRSGWDLVVSKAAGPFPRLLPLVRTLARPGALYVTAKGSEWRDELERAAAHDFTLAGARSIAPGRGEAVALRFTPSGMTRFT